MLEDVVYVRDVRDRANQKKVVAGQPFAHGSCYVQQRGLESARSILGRPFLDT